MNIESCTINCIDGRVGQFIVCGPPKDNSVMPQMRNGIYEPHIQRLFCGLVQPGMTVCDIGANFGQHTVVLSKLVGPTGQVFAIEASPINSEYIHHTIAANNLTNVTVIQCGVWSHETELTFSHVEGAEATSFYSNKNDIRDIEPNPACKYQTIDVSTLDKLVPDAIDFIKIDIEGSELFAMKGAQNFLRRKAPILMELNVFTSKTFMGVDVIEIIEYMESNGYCHMYTWNQNQWISVTKTMLMTAFDRGNKLIDVLFSAESYTPGRLSGFKRICKEV